MKNKSDSKLSITEHPSTFKKPEIEMTSKPVEKEEVDPTSIFKTELRNDNK